MSPFNEPLSLRACVLRVALATVAWAPLTAAAIPSQLSGPPCRVGTAVQITPDCLDAQYQFPVIDFEGDELLPVPHRRFIGRFNGTRTTFSIYLPKENWDGRFFQLMYPLQENNATVEAVGFGAESGAYTVQTNGGLGYRGDAAAAKIARLIASDYYKTNRTIHGYIYGGSGGSLQVVGAMENTRDVWDGGIPLIQAVPASYGLNWASRALAALALENKGADIEDAVRPGGSGDPFINSLSPVQKSALEEATAIGMPLRAWEDFESAGLSDHFFDSMRVTSGQSTKANDPTYVDDFWSKPGYLGFDEGPLGEIVQKQLVDYEATVACIKRGADGVPTAIIIDKTPNTTRSFWLDLTIKSQGNDVGSISGKGTSGSKTIFIHKDSNSTLLGTLRSGTKLRVDNRWLLAMHSLHRHQVPTREGFNGYNHLRDASGAPKYPQRSKEVAVSAAVSTSGGSNHTGLINGKMILMNNLMDVDAFPWHADWYKNQVKMALGDRLADNFRLYFNDNADHNMGAVISSNSNRLLDFTGLYEQHLRDLAAWVEQGKAPPTATEYSIQNSQVKVPATAEKRKGIQPVVHLIVGSAKRIDVKVGQKVTFNVKVEVPSESGKVVSVQWDFEGSGSLNALPFGEVSSRVSTTATYTYTKPGTYYAGVHVASHRDGNLETPYALARNIDRVRVVVKG